ncbi:MAG TPA: pitrilysin family protein [Myxococcales bacterium]|jgi:zinc protease|nr:pitrilysin family protein [Myxococcales bacterium]
MPLILCVLLALTAAPKRNTPLRPEAPPQPARAFAFPTQVETLPNGLRIVLIPYDSPGLAAYYTLMRVGSRNEPEPGRSGYAHFFEHMMFRRTKKHSSEDYNNTMTRLGLDTNAYTGLDLTVYHLYGPSKALPTIIEYESDRFENLDYTEAQFKTEAGAILGEYAKSASDPEQKLYEVMQNTAFTRHTYKHTPIGFLEDIKAMPSGFEYSREFFRRYYTPDDATIVVVGDFDKADILARLKSAYSGWKGKLDPAPIPREPRQNSSRRATIAWNAPTIARLYVTWHGQGANDLHTAAIQAVLSPYLFGETSALYQDVVLKRQIVDSISPQDGVNRDPFLFGAMLRVKDDKNLRAVELAVLRQISTLVRGRIDAARLAAIKSNVRYSIIAALDKPDSIANTLVQYTALTGDLDYLNALAREIDSLTPSMLQDFGKRAFLDAHRTTVTLTYQPPARAQRRPAAKAPKGGGR